MAGNKWLAIAWRDRELLALLEKLSRHRPLAAEEAALMQSLTYRCYGRQNERWWWTAEEDAELMKLNRRWARYGRPVPYQEDSQVRDLADLLGRSYLSVHKRLQRLRKKHGWKQPQMSKREAQNTGLELRNGHARETANGEASSEGRPASIGFAPAEAGRPQGTRRA